MTDSILNVLDAIVRMIGIVVLIGGVLLLFILLWDLMDPDPDYRPEDVLVPEDSMTDKQRAAIEMARDMGLKTRFDYADYGGGMAERLGECYMLAAKAMLFDDRNRNNMPMPAALIHGSWHGPTSESRIDHAVVLLDTGDIWEPITAGIYSRTRFEAYTRWQRHQIYSAAEARQHMMDTGHYGPW